MINFKFLSKDKISKLPKTSGVYAFKNKKEILYIGKAINIKERVKNHFSPIRLGSGQATFKDNFLIERAQKVGYIKTDSEIEALLLEANLIKKLQPKYNAMWKDDKNYFYVGITKENYPIVFITHQIKSKIKSQKSKVSYLGPFVEGTSLKRTLTYLRKVFPYYTARNHPQKSCLWCNLKLCPGPDPNKKEYNKNIRNLISVLKGKSKKVLKDLKREMEKVSKMENYEKAGKLRDRFFMLEKVISHSRVIEPALIFKTRLPSEWQYKRIEAYDISNIQGKEATGSMVVATDGKLDKSQYRKFKVKIAGKPNDTAMIREILSRRFIHKEWQYPNLILIDGGKAQLNIAIKSKLQNPNYKNVKIMSVAKRNNELFIEGRKKPILLKTLPREVFNLILQLRDEAHRFAISYHKKLRRIDLLGGR